MCNSVCEKAIFHQRDAIHHDGQALAVSLSSPSKADRCVHQTAVFAYARTRINPQSFGGGRLIGREPLSIDYLHAIPAASTSWCPILKTNDAY